MAKPHNRRPPIPAGNIYPAIPPRPYVFWVWIGLAALCFAAAFLLPRPPQVPLPVFKLQFGGLAVLAVFFAWAGLSATSLRVEIVGTVLRIYGGFFYGNVKADDLDIASARIVDLAEQPEFAPVWWLYGAGLPGFAAGLYLLRRQGQAWAVLTGRRQVLWLPRKKGRPYLLSLQDGAGLLARLQKYASRPKAGGEK